MDKYSSEKVSLLLQLGQMFVAVSRSFKAKISVLLLLTLFSTLFEIASIGAVIPFLKFILEPLEFRQQMQEFIPFVSNPDVVSKWFSPYVVGTLFASIFFVSFLLRNALTYYTIVVSNRMSVRLGETIFDKVFGGGSYQYVSNTNPATLMTLLTSRVGTVSAIFLAGISAAISIVIILSVMLFLMLVEPIIISTVAVSLVAAYSLFAIVVKGTLVRNSEVIVRMDTVVLQTIKETAANIRHVLLEKLSGNSRESYVGKYSKLLDAIGINRFLQTAPKFLIEFVATAVLIAVASVAAASEDRSPADIFAMLAAVAVAAQRMLPYSNQIFGFWTAFAGSAESVAWVYKRFSVHRSVGGTAGALRIADEVSSRAFGKIEIRDAKFAYTDPKKFSLSVEHLLIQSGDKVLIQGDSGSGKSTFVDMLVGLLHPQEGRIIRDGEERDPNNLEEFYELFSYVPQDVYLTNDSILNNVHLNRSKKYHPKEIQAAIRQACAEEFVDSLPEKLETVISDHGSSLSGGQKQRIGIARALYRKSSILIFDEATNGIDHAKEQAILTSLLDQKDLTFIMITHHKVLHSRFDLVLLMDSGRLTLV